MSEVTDILADCPDSVTVAFGALTTPAIFIVRTVSEDFGGELSTNVPREHLVIATGVFPGLAKKSAVTITFPDASTLSRIVREVRPKDDDRALSYVSLEKA